ncbi:6435_t:CDS:2, partial [Acaulospora colombiana]
ILTILVHTRTSSKKSRLQEMLATSEKPSLTPEQVEAIDNETYGLASSKSVAGTEIKLEGFQVADVWFRFLILTCILHHMCVLQGSDQSAESTRRPHAFPASDGNSFSQETYRGFIVVNN